MIKRKIDAMHEEYGCTINAMLKMYGSGREVPIKMQNVHIYIESPGGAKEAEEPMEGQIEMEGLT